MGNMARDRCYSRSLILAILAFDLFCFINASQSVNAQYHYEIDEDTWEDPDLKFELYPDPISDTLTLDRRRRAAPPQPQSSAPSSQEQPPKPANEQQQQPVINGKANASSVTYSTAAGSSGTDGITYSSVSSTTTIPHDGSSSTIGPPTQAGKMSSKGVIVSTPIVPSNDKNNTAGVNGTLNAGEPGIVKAEKPKVHVWANQTMWPNVTESKGNAEGGLETDMDDFTIDNKYPAEVTNKTIHDHNITMTQNDTHQYYNSTFSNNEERGKKFWIDLENHPDTQVNTLLSKSHRRAATIKLKFDFPFYGHKVRNITIATGGFLYTGEYVHSWLAATQYIAPLMANFDTTLSPDSFVKYADNGTAFTVEWKNVHLQDKPDSGAFTFQVTLLQNGDIIFVYPKIPMLVESIEDKEHPVKIGLSDAYMMDRTVFFARRKTIYEYHRVNFNRQDIRNWTVIYLKALPTCLPMDNCHDCLTKIKDFDCKWCPELNKCSTGTFRFRQDWLQKGCDLKNVKEPGKCPAPSAATIFHDHGEVKAEDHRADDDDDMPLTSKYGPSQSASSGPASSSLEHAQDNMNMGVSGIIGILFVVSLIAGLGAWATYAYRNPHSASGQMLIRYRPSQWSWRRGEARYTAATIHM